MCFKVLRDENGIGMVKCETSYFIGKGFSLWTFELVHNISRPEVTSRRREGIVDEKVSCVEFCKLQVKILIFLKFPFYFSSSYFYINIFDSSLFLSFDYSLPSRWLLLWPKVLGKLTAPF